MIESAANRKQRALLATTYGAGLRVSEVVRLPLHHLDAERGSLRVEQGKGAKDRDTLLSPRLLEELRAYWRQYRPAEWLFPGRDGKRPLDVSTAQKVYYAAKGKAGVTKRGGIHALRQAGAYPAARRDHPSPRGRHRPAHHPAALGPRRPQHHHALLPPGPADAPEDHVPAGVAGPGHAPGTGLAGEHGAGEASDRARGHCPGSWPPVPPGPPLDPGAAPGPPGHRGLPDGCLGRARGSV